jgi:membrane fusion protein (multidrug efflux system)
LPTTAISFSLYGDSVYLIEKDKEKPEHSIAKRVFVVTGEQQGNYTVIKKGVKPGQQIVNSGELKLQEGTAVVVNNDVELNEHSGPLGP